MNFRIKPPVVASALIALVALYSSHQVHAQEAMLVYASNVAATSSLKDIDTEVTPQRLARDFSLELAAELDLRLTQEQSKLAEMLRIKEDFNVSIQQDLDIRLKQEMRNLTASLQP